jgi:hypothetical protein
MQKASKPTIKEAVYEAFTLSKPASFIHTNYGYSYPAINRAKKRMDITLVKFRKDDYIMQLERELHELRTKYNVK